MTSFQKKGYKEAGISEIAKRAGVAVGSFYNYYNNKGGYLPGCVR